MSKKSTPGPSYRGLKEKFLQNCPLKLDGYPQKLYESKLYELKKYEMDCQLIVNTNNENIILSKNI